MVILETLVSVIGGFISAVIAGILIRRWLDHYYRPIIVIEGNETIVIRQTLLQTQLDPGGGATIIFYANRIRVRNAGKTAAKECKAYVNYNDNDVERTAWMISNTTNEFTVTLNVEDRIFIDLCATSEDRNQPRVIPLERGYLGSVDACTRLPPGDRIITVRITSSNASPTERVIRLHTNVNHFPQQPGRIVEFVE